MSETALTAGDSGSDATKTLRRPLHTVDVETMCLMCWCQLNSDSNFLPCTVYIMFKLHHQCHHCIHSSSGVSDVEQQICTCAALLQRFEM